MDGRIIRHLESIRPSVDVLGEWLVTCNAKTAQKGMMNTVLTNRQITHRRGDRKHPVRDIPVWGTAANAWSHVGKALN